MDRTPQNPPPGANLRLTRRQTLLGLVATGALAAGAAGARPAVAQSAAQAHIVIAGAGAAGLTAASQLASRLPRARITIIDRNERHYFQPGYTLVGSGVWEESQVVTETSRFIPSRVNWIKADVAEFDPDVSRVATSTGQTIDYDFLIVATGVHLGYEAIEGMEEALIGREGVASVYAGPEAAAASWAAMARFAEAGGQGHFGRPLGEMKCAGAPLKIALLAEDRLTGAGGRGRAELHYHAQNKVLFAVPPVHDKLLEIFANRGVNARYEHVLRAIDPGARRATYATPDGDVEFDYDFIHVVPPMRAPDAVLNSPLGWREGPYAKDGWLEVDRSSMRHTRYPNVFGIGDINGVPRGKTAASVKWQAPVAVTNLIAAMEGREPTAIYNGYTSCPLVTRVGSAMLIEFDYDGTLIPSFPFIDPLQESWISWLIEEKALKPTYYAMLRGYA
ncbi:MAG: pyridine nucleotide-disulfide oxidoreductase [Salinarimonadaceae bacterium]|nr:MAG: pyridine nucleotide-disulfide oxidoreductase [Salinarimonadaceae bacterium]